MFDEGEGFKFWHLLVIVCVIGAVAGNTWIGKGAKALCQAGKICQRAATAAPTAPAGLRGYYLIQARHSGKCLDIPFASQGDSVQVNQFTCNGARNQQWTLVPG